MLFFIISLNAIFYYFEVSFCRPLKSRWKTLSNAKENKYPMAIFYAVLQLHLLAVLEYCSSVVKKDIQRKYFSYNLLAKYIARYVKNLIKYIFPLHKVNIGYLDGFS